MAMTAHQKRMVAQLASRFIAFQSQSYLYPNFGVDMRKTFESWEENMRKLNIDFNNLSKADAEILGMMKFSGEQNLYCMPLSLYRVLPKGTELHDIFGNKVVVGKDKIDDDNRMGMLAYGVIIKG